MGKQISIEFVLILTSEATWLFCDILITKIGQGLLLTHPNDASKKLNSYPHTKVQYQYERKKAH